MIGVSFITRIAKADTIKANIISSVFFKGAFIAGQLYLIPLTLSILTKAEFGLWVTVVTIVTWLSLADFGVGNGLRNALVETIETSRKKARAQISSAYLLSVFSGALILGAFLLASSLWGPQLFYFKGLEVATVYKVFAISICLFVVRIFLNNINFINYSFQKASRNDMLQMVIILLTLAVISLFKYFEVVSLIVLAYIYGIVPLAVLFCYSLFFYYRERDLAPKVSLVSISSMKSLSRSGFSFFFIQIVSLILFTSPLVITAKWFGTESTSELSVANRYYGLSYMAFGIMLTPFWSAFTKARAAGDFVWESKSFRKIIQISYILVAALVVQFFVSKLIYRLWLKDSIDISFSANLSMLLFNVSLVLIAPLNYYMNGTNMLKPQVILGVFNLIFFAPLVYFFSNTLNLQMWGVFTASTTTILINFIVSKILIRRKYDSYLRVQSI